MSNLLVRFREKLAESGTELTLEEAKNWLDAALKLIKQTKNASQRELWQEIECLSQSGVWPDGQPLKEGEIKELTELLEHAKEL